MGDKLKFPIDNIVLRQPEKKDLCALYVQKNDPEIAKLLGGFSNGYSNDGLLEWLDFHRECNDEVLWTIAGKEKDDCLGHVGLYKIDQRIRSAEFAIMIGDKSTWGHGIGPKVSWFVIEYGFNYLNLNRIQLTVLSTNTRALNLYKKLGFKEEGIQREAQFKGGCYEDLVLMSILRREYDEFKKISP